MPSASCQNPLWGLHCGNGPSWRRGSILTVLHLITIPWTELNFYDAKRELTWIPPAFWILHNHYRYLHWIPRIELHPTHDPRECYRSIRQSQDYSYCNRNGLHTKFSTSLTFFQNFVAGNGRRGQSLVVCVRKLEWIWCWWVESWFSPME